MTVPLTIPHSYVVLGWMALCLLGLILLRRPWNTWFAAGMTLVMIVSLWALT